MHAYHFFFFFFLHPDISALRGQKRFKPFTMWPSWSSMKMHCSHPQIHRSGAVGAKRVCQGRGSWPTNCIVVRWCCRGAQTFPIKQTTAKIPKCRSLDGVKFCSTRLNFTVWLFFCSFCQRRGTLLPTCACVGFILPFGQDGRQCFFEGGGVGKSECPTAHGMGNTRWIQEVLAKLIRFAVIKMLPFGSDLILADGCWWKPYREAEAAWNLIDRNRILVKDWEAKPSIWAPLRFWTPRPLSPPSSPSTIFFVHDIPLWVLGGVENDFKKSLKIILGPVWIITLQHLSEQTLFLLYNSCVFWGDGKLSYQEPRSRCHGGMPIWQFISICFCWQKVLLKDIWSTLHRQVSKSMMCMIYDYNWLYDIIYI